MRRYFYTKNELFLKVHQNKIGILIPIFLYWLLIQPNLIDMTGCSPTPVDPSLSACLEAQQLAIENAQENSVSKSWLCGKSQTVLSNGIQGDTGTGTVIKDNETYTVQIVHVKDDKGTYRLLSDCMKGGPVKKGTSHTS